jgi:hypothetical protein
MFSYTEPISHYDNIEQKRHQFTLRRLCTQYNMGEYAIDKNASLVTESHTQYYRHKGMHVLTHTTIYNMYNWDYYVGNM